VTIFQRGAVDGLNMIVPHGDSAITIFDDRSLSRSQGKTNGAIDLDGHFGLHPSMSALAPFWKDKSSPSSMQLARLTTRDRISMRRITWSRHARQ
jgi:uncharacterized protein (DUF1501 family)